MLKLQYISVSELRTRISCLQVFDSSATSQRKPYHLSCHWSIFFHVHLSLTALARYKENTLNKAANVFWVTGYALAASILGSVIISESLLKGTVSRDGFGFRWHIFGAQMRICYFFTSFELVLPKTGYKPSFELLWYSPVKVEETVEIKCTCNFVSLLLFQYAMLFGCVAKSAKSYPENTLKVIKRQYMYSIKKNTSWKYTKDFYFFAVYEVGSEYA